MKIDPEFSTFLSTAMIAGYKIEKESDYEENPGNNPAHRPPPHLVRSEWAQSSGAIGVECDAPAVELVEHDPEQLACPEHKKLRSSDVSEDGVLSGDAPALTVAGVFGGDGHLSPHRMITSPKRDSAT